MNFEEKKEESVEHESKVSSVNEKKINSDAVNVDILQKENIVKKEFYIRGMTCTSCEKIMEEIALEQEGVKELSVDYATGRGIIKYDQNKTNLNEIFNLIEKKGYDCSINLFSPKPSTQIKVPRWIGWMLGLIGLGLIAYFGFGFIDGIQLPQISQNMGYGLLLVVGLLTGFHCISMCGGFVVSYTAKNAQAGVKSHKSHLLYGAGKTLSYTIIGAIFGLVGSIIAFTPMMRGVAGLIAGLFLVLYGLKMLNLFPVLRKLTIRTPRFIAKWVGSESSKHSNPLVIGLFNGFMIACGPLQAIYIMAAGTGSMLEGAKLLFVFGAGTLPALLGFGYFASYLSNKATHKILKASGAIVLVLGLLMMNNGLVLTGSGYDFGSLLTKSTITDVTAKAAANGGELGVKMSADGFQEIKMEVTRYGWNPDKFVLKKGVPVRWKINGVEINGCNNAIQVPKYGLNFKVKQGEQIIEFTPGEEGIIRWSCWMGMIPGTFIVKDDIDLNNVAAVAEEIAAIPNAPTGGGCGGGGGGCGCGGGRL